MVPATNERNGGASAYLAAAWAAVEKVAAKEGGRDDLTPAHPTSSTSRWRAMSMARRWNNPSAAFLPWGTISPGDKLATPAQPRLVAAILAKLNQVTRNRVLRELPAEFAASAGLLPVADEQLVTEAEEMLRKLRAEHEVVARGAVRCEYKLMPAGEPALQPA